MPRFRHSTAFAAPAKAPGDDFSLRIGFPDHGGRDADQLQILIERRSSRPPELTVVRFVPDFEAGDAVAVTVHNGADKVFPRPHGPFPVADRRTADRGGMFRIR